MMTYALFLKDRTWKKGCPFKLEFPFLDIPSMVNDKIVRWILQSEFGKIDAARKTDGVQTQKKIEENPTGSVST